MIELVMRFKETSHFYIWAAVVAACVVWAYRSRKDGYRQLWPLICLNFLLFLAWGAVSNFSHDDIAFLHFAWLISKGLVPFRDFWEHHSPFLPVIMAPFMKAAPHSPAIFDMARIASGLIFVANALLGWRIAAQVWQAKARLSVYLLFVSAAAIIGQYFILRADIFMAFFLLAGISICLDLPRKGPAACAVCGMAFGLAMSFITKQYLLVFLPIIAIFFGQRQGRAVRAMAYALGFCAGIVPLAAYLVSAGIVDEFFYWVFGFNARQMKMCANFPFMYLVAGIGGGVVLARRYRASGEARYALLLCAVILSALSSLTTMSDQDPLLYYHGLWYFLCAIAVCGAGVWERLSDFRPRWKNAVVAGCVLGLLLAPNVVSVWKHRAGDYARDRKAAAELMRYTGSDTCVVLLPAHPVLVHDATRLYSSWQFVFLARHADVRNDAAGPGFARQILTRRPAVMSAEFGTRDFFLELYHRRVISADEYKDLMALIMTDYRKRRIGRQLYYIRADVLAKS
ncbi:MAG TPA: hypothetical protein PK562_01665 [Candidatus Omnitrophota bacterium]|nr:hypothetical protein [Candidatus Omnitrophota bacterium]